MRSMLIGAGFSLSLLACAAAEESVKEPDGSSSQPSLAVLADELCHARQHVLLHVPVVEGQCLTPAREGWMCVLGADAEDALREVWERELASAGCTTERAPLHVGDAGASGELTPLLKDVGQPRSTVHLRPVVRGGEVTLLVEGAGVSRSVNLGKAGGNLDPCERWLEVGAALDQDRVREALRERGYPVAVGRDAGSYSWPALDRREHEPDVACVTIAEEAAPRWIADEVLDLLRSLPGAPETLYLRDRKDGRRGAPSIPDCAGQRELIVDVAPLELTGELGGVLRGRALRVRVRAQSEVKVSFGERAPPEARTARVEDARTWELVLLRSPTRPRIWIDADIEPEAAPRIDTLLLTLVGVLSRHGEVVQVAPGPFMSSGDVVVHLTASVKPELAVGLGYRSSVATVALEVLDSRGSRLGAARARGDAPPVSVSAPLDFDLDGIAMQEAIHSLETQCVIEGALGQPPTG